MGLTMPRAGDARSAERLASLAVVLLTLAFGITVAWLLRAKWLNFDPFLFDFAIGTRVYEKLAHGIPFTYAMHYYTVIYMGVYPLLLPLYALFPSPLLLFSLHVLCFTAAIPLLYRIGRQVLPGVLLPLAVVVAYVLNPSIDMMALSFLRQEALWMVFFFLTISLAESRRNRAADWCAVGACVVRMDAAPAIFLLGFLYVLRKRGTFGWRLMKLSLLVMGLMTTGMLVLYLVTGIRPDPQQFHLAGAAGPSAFSPRQVLSAALQTLASPASYAHFVVMLPFLFLPLLAPLYLLPGLASAAFIVLSYQGWRDIPQVAALLSPDSPLVPCLHVHDSYLLPVLFVAMVHGIRNLHDRFVDWAGLRERAAGLFRAGLAATLAVLFFLVHWFYATPELGPVPLTPAFDRAYYRQTGHARLAWSVLERVPRDQAGLMQFSFAERAARHPLITEIYPWCRVEPGTRYALFDLRAPSPNMPKPDLLEIAIYILRREDFRVDFFEDGILLLTRGVADTKNREVLDWIEENRAALAGEQGTHP